MGSTSACMRMAAYRGEAGCEMLEEFSFLQKNGLKRTLAEPRKPHFSLASPIFRSQASFFRLQASFFRLQALFSTRHTPLFRLISLHERRSRNMMARIGGRFRPPLRLNSLHERRSRNMMARVVQHELSALSNLIRTVKRSLKTSFQQPFVPQTLPPGRTEGRRGGASNG